MKLKILIDELERWSPPALQESYDNCGLQCGDPEQEITGVLCCLDCTEAVIQEALEKGCQVILTHHPLLFSPVKKIDPGDPIHRCLIKAIQNHLAIYSLHTSLDNLRGGVNQMLIDRLGLINCQVLRPKPATLLKLIVYVPDTHTEPVREALFAAGAGKIGKYDECSFESSGQGSFRPLSGAQPFLGKEGLRERVAESRIEVVLEKWRKGEVLRALRSSHPYEEIAYDVFELFNSSPDYGAGAVGDLPAALSEEDFLAYVKERLSLSVIRYTRLAGRSVPIERVALCGGSGSFLMNDVLKSGARAFISADFKYHQFFESRGEFMICDIGHFESERFTIDLLAAFLSKKFPKFAVRLTDTLTNPVHYYF